MSKVGISITAYSIYLGIGGAVLAFIPNWLLQVLGLPLTDEFWIRLFGILAFLLAAKGIYAARLNLVPVMQFDVYTRACFATFMTGLVVMGLAPRILLGMAIIDILGAVWTQVAIFAERRAAAT